MKIPFISLVCLFLQHNASAQQLQQRDYDPVDLDSIDMNTSVQQQASIDQIPKFKGSEKDFSAYIERHLIYPEEARKQKIKGTVYVLYTIDVKGKIKNAVVIQSSNALLNNAALNVITNSPKWKPGISKGKPVPYKNLSKVIFKL